MTRPATLAWFAAHELRLVWRDWISFRTGGRRRREPLVVAVAILIVALIHLLARSIVAPLAADGVAPDAAVLVTITAGAVMSWALMLSQAIESVTRAFYARADLDLILSSPAPAPRLFAVRMVAVALASTVLTTALVAPFLNVLIVYDGIGWIAGYGVLCAMGALSTAIAVLVSGLLFRSFGPRRTRLISQLVSAVIAAGFVIGVQVVAILSTGSLSRLSLFRTQGFVAAMPGPDSVVWWPARAAMGEPLCLAVVLGLSLAVFALVVRAFAASFAANVAATAGAADARRRGRVRVNAFRPAAGKGALRRKDRLLVRRDPWLLSQTLMQILYLLPPILIIWLSFGEQTGSLLMVVPILVMAAGQLAGGLAWLVISGEDAPDLVASAPVSTRTILAAKTETVLGGVAVLIAPPAAALAFVDPVLALCAVFGAAAAALSGMMIQFWFRDLTPPRSLRRRQIPSRLATLAEAVSALLWGGTAALAASGSWIAIIMAAVALSAVSTIGLLRPGRQPVA